MTWTRLSDDFGDDCWTLTDAGFRLHVEGLAWSNRKLLDLRIPKDDLRRFAKSPEAVEELVAVGWWTDDGDAYVIRHHAQYQRTREQVVAAQEAAVSNGRKGGRPRKAGREQAPKSTSETQPVSQSVSQSQSRSGTQRDGTGRAPTDQPQDSETKKSRDTHARAKPDPAASAAHRPTPPVVAPLREPWSGPDEVVRRCHVCSGPVRRDLWDEYGHRTHPNCDPVEFRTADAIAAGVR